VLAEPPFLTSERGDQWFEAVRQSRPGLSLQRMAGAWRALMESLYVYGPDEDARADFLRQGLLGLEAPEHTLAGYYCGGDLTTARLPVWRPGARAFDDILAKSSNGHGHFTIDPVSPNVKRFPHKVLLVAGSCDAIIGAEAQRQHMSLFSNAELAIIASAGHTMFGEQPEASLAVLRRYLGEDHSAIVASD
jgi:pimeloyl-ACP methyl ester carboxylesterase